MHSKQTPIHATNANFCNQSLHHQSSHHRRKGFTLAELMAVIVILGLLATIMTVGIRGYMAKSRRNLALLELSTLSQALESYHTEKGRYPRTDEGLQVLFGTDDSDGFMDGKAPGKDPWRNDYDYISPAENSDFLVICYGADGREGGTGADEDITSEDLTRADTNE